MTTDPATKGHPTFCGCDKCQSGIAMQHRAADEACSRDWDTGGCQCGACKLTRKILAEIDAGFARVTAAEDALAEHRRKKAQP